MFITVKFGSNETLLCNPSCASINLLDNIKRRVGLTHSEALLDLSDDTGLIKELDLHRFEYATRFLTSQGTYILVEKQVLPPDDGEEDDTSTYPPQITYTPMLDGWKQLLPNFQIRVNQQQVSKKRKGRTASKSPSPAGKVVASKKGRDKPVRKPKKSTAAQ